MAKVSTSADRGDIDKPACRSRSASARRLVRRGPTTIVPAMNEHAAVVSFYEAALSQHGEGPKAVGWNSADAQELLFVSLFDGMGPLPKGARILDVGCGLGALYGRLPDLIGEGFEYTGYDLSPAMVEEARRRHPGGRFEVRDILVDPPPARSFDYVVMSGAINFRVPSHDRYARKIIARVFSLATHAACFNLLSRSAFDAEIHQTAQAYFYCAPEDVVAFARRLTPLLNLKHDATRWTFTMQLFQPGGHPPASLAAFQRSAERAKRQELNIGLAQAWLNAGFSQRALAVLDALPESADVLVEKAQCLHQQGASEKERTCLLQALALDPDHVGALAALAGVEFLAGHLAETSALLERAVAVAPTDEGLLEQLCYARLSEGKEEAAEAIAVRVQRRAQRAMCAGEIAFRRKQWAEAAAEFRAALDAAPALTRAHWRLATIAQREDRANECRHHFEQVLRYTPNDREARIRLARVLLETGAHAECVSLLEDEVFDAELDSLRARALRELGHVEEAETAEEEARASNPATSSSSADT
jgi:tetratricopeptide (TPR) repeat protein